MERGSGDFVRLLRKPIVMKPTGDRDPIPDEWLEGEGDDQKISDEDEDEAAWRARCEATYVQKAEPRDSPDAEVPASEAEMAEETAECDDLAAEEYMEGEEEETAECDDFAAANHGDGNDAGGDESGYAGGDVNDKAAGDDGDDEKEQEARNAQEYAEMDSDRTKLAEYLKNQKKRKVPPEDGSKDEELKEEDDHRDTWKNHHRNKGRSYGKGWNNKGWNNRQWWPKGKGKGKNKGKSWGKWQNWSRSEDWRWNEDHGPKGAASSHSGGHGHVLRADNKGGAGEGLKAAGKSRVRGGVKIQQIKHKQKMEEERKQQNEHQRSLTMKLATITEKALDKLPS
eukprot:s4510_g3.t1